MRLGDIYTGNLCLGDVQLGSSHYSNFTCRSFTYGQDQIQATKQHSDRQRAVRQRLTRQPHLQQLITHGKNWQRAALLRDGLGARKVRGALRLLKVALELILGSVSLPRSIKQREHGSGGEVSRTTNSQAHTLKQRHTAECVSSSWFGCTPHACRLDFGWSAPPNCSPPLEASSSSSSSSCSRACALNTLHLSLPPNHTRFTHLPLLFRRLGRLLLLSRGLICRLLFGKPSDGRHLGLRHVPELGAALCGLLFLADLWGMKGQEQSTATHRTNTPPLTQDAVCESLLLLADLWGMRG